MNRIIVLLLLAVALAGCQAAPANYDDCILQSVKPGMDKRAVNAIDAACEDKFPHPLQPSVPVAASAGHPNPFADLIPANAPWLQQYAAPAAPPAAPAQSGLIDFDSLGPKSVAAPTANLQADTLAQIEANQEQAAHDAKAAQWNAHLDAMQAMQEQEQGFQQQQDNLQHANEDRSK